MPEIFGVICAVLVEINCSSNSLNPSRTALAKRYLELNKSHSLPENYASRYDGTIRTWDHSPWLSGYFRSQSLDAVCPNKLVSKSTS